MSLSKPNNIKPRTILAFDYGLKKIGIAVGQEISMTASPLPPIKAKEGIPNWDNLGNIINEWQPDLLVVGHPLNMDGTDNEITIRARKFCNRLNGRYQRPSTLMDERLSTFEAKEIIIEKGKKRNFKDDPVDSVAAALILESWFTENARS